MSHEYEDEDRDESDWREYEDAPGRMLPTESWLEETDELTDEEDPEVLAESVTADEEFAEEDFSVAPAKGVMYGPQQQSSPGRQGGVKLPQPRVGCDGQKGRKLVKPEEVRLPFSRHERVR